MSEHTDRERLMPVVTEDGEVDTRETVFQVWALLADRSPTRTARRVGEEFGLHVSPDVVRKWSTRHDWDLKARELFEQTAPTYFGRTRAALVGGVPEAAGYLVDVAAGRALADRVRVIASAAVLDRVGFLSFTRKDAERGATPMISERAGDQWAALDDADMRAIVAGRVQSLGSG